MSPSASVVGISADGGPVFLFNPVQSPYSDLCNYALYKYFPFDISQCLLFCLFSAGPLTDTVTATGSGLNKKVFEMGFWTFVCHRFKEYIDNSHRRGK